MKTVGRRQTLIKSAVSRLKNKYSKKSNSRFTFFIGDISLTGAEGKQL